MSDKPLSAPVAPPPGSKRGRKESLRHPSPHLSLPACSLQTEVPPQCVPLPTSAQSFFPWAHSTWPLFPGPPTRKEEVASSLIFAWLWPSQPLHTAEVTSPYMVA